MNWKFLTVFVLTLMFTIETLGASFSNQQLTYRCDYGSESDSGSMDFTLMNTPYDHKDITYKITAYSNKLSRSIIDDTIADAFNAWSAVTDLTFTKKNSGNVDVVIRFAEYSHNCPGGKAFDGPGNVVAHASKSYLHFDETENWSTGISSNVINFYSIAVHEIGHVLGLSHSSFKESIMYDTYSPNNVVMKLHSDDIAGIQHLYGAKTTRGNGNGNGGSGGGGGGIIGNDCWTTGCQPNTWAVVGCSQYQRVEKSKTRCPGGYMYECCTTTGGSAPVQPRGTSGRGNSGSWSECWTTGCQLSSWAVVGCGQYGMTQIEKYSCSGGNMYKCCK